MQKAPYYAHVADGPDDAEAYWLTASDGVRLRMGVMCQKAKSGTVLLFPGRTEYVEKYGRAARDLGAAGYATVVMDWRGQGLADRLMSDPMSGHVLDFTDYQKDVAAMINAAEALDLPKPFHMLAHSMGACIGLRAAMEGLPVASCAFSGPMWGVQLKAIMRAVAWTVSWSSRRVGLDHVYAPTSTNADSYVLIEPFETNKLTRDREMYQYMIDQTRACPELGLGGPSLRWLNEALAETRRLARRPSPPLPCFAFAGTDETIVDLGRITARMQAWPGAQMEWIESGKHEVLMDTTDIRAQVFAQMTQFFDAQSESQAPLRCPA